MGGKPELVLDARALLGEGAIWDARRGVLHWVDIEGFLVHTFDPRTGRDRAVPVGEHVGCLAPRARGGLVVALRRGLAVLDPETGALEPRVAPPGHLPEVRFNDGRTDPEGRLWAGTMELSFRPGAASLWRLDPDWSLHRMVEGVTISNGPARPRDPDPGAALGWAVQGAAGGVGFGERGVRGVAVGRGQASVLAFLLALGAGARGGAAEPPWTLGPFVKDDAANPILMPSAEGTFPCPI